MAEPAQENRLKSFASFFKGYMSIMPIVTAALAPVLTLVKALPMFESQKTTLATFTGLFGFLLVAWVFFARSVFVPLMTTDGSRSSSKYFGALQELTAVSRRGARMLIRSMVSFLPLALIIFSAYSFVNYSSWLDENIAKIRLERTPVGGGKDQTNLTRQVILQTGGMNEVLPKSSQLIGWYLSIFLSAELAFVLMALREYGYSTLHISEQQVLSGSNFAKPDSPSRAVQRSETADDAKP